MGWGGFLDKLMDKLPIQGREERWKNELENLQKERAKIIGGKWSYEKNERLNAIDVRIDYLNQCLRNRK
jgi:hypothetical protein